MTKSKNSPDQHIKIMSTMKLEEFEQKLATDPDNDQFKTNLTGSVTELQDEILPLRLKFNEFLNIMATLDKEDGANNNNNSKMSPQERFNMVKTNLVSLHDDIQRLSKDFQSLEELFGCIAEYSSINQSKEFEPLECLSINYTSNITTGTNTPNHTTGTPNSTVHGKKSVVHSHPNNKTSPQGNTPSSTTVIAATPNTSANVTGSGNTPAMTPTATSTTTKKLRKPRQPRKQSAATSGSQSSTPASGNISMNTANMNNASKMQSPAMIQTPLMVSNGNTPLTSVNMNMGQGTMNPSTILGMTSNSGVNTNNINTTNNGMNVMPSGNNSTILSPANVLNNAILNTGGNGNNSNTNNSNSSSNNNNMNTPSGALSNVGAPNSLTPANILSMSNVNMNNILPGSSANANINTNANNGNDLANMDLTTLDLSSLNMDFL
ncbi:mediator complex subunit [Monosporozyma unispora]|nr:mediator complex subunit [Kazachstania unispora]